MNKIFRALSDQTRRQVLELLRGGDLTAGQLADRSPLARSTLSEHLSVLKDAGLIVAERHGTTIMYSLNESALEEVVAAVMAMIAPTHRREASHR